MEFVVRADGFMTERGIQELARWYAEGDAGGGQEDFEAHLLLLRTYAALMSSAQRGRRIPMSAERYSMLRLLYRAPEQRLQMAEIGRALDVSATSITKLVNGTSELGWVKRVPHTKDKRRTWIELTAEGRALIENQLPNARAATRERWKSLNRDEKRMLIHLLSKLLLGTDPSAVEASLQALHPANGASSQPPPESDT